MNRTHTACVLFMGATFLAVGCNSTEKKSSAAPIDSSQGKPADDMADMPGMANGAASTPGQTAAPSTHVTFTAAQVAHGGVKWGAVAMGTATTTATVPGEVTPNEDRTVRLGAPARGRVLSVAVRPGDHVASGQPLVTLQSPEAGMAQADVAKAEAEIASRRSEAQYATSARARADRLLALKAIPRQEYERALADDDHARRALDQAEAEARRARTTVQQLGAGNAANGEIVLRAPASGVVLSRDAVPGAVVEAGAPLAVVTELSNLWLTINAPETMVSMFARGNRLRFTVPAYPQDTFVARVDAVGAGLESATRTLSVRAVVTNADHRLKPQMFATVIVDGGGAVTAAFVPEDAVQLLQGKPCVFLAVPDANGGARFERRDVVLGARRNGRIAILKGLANGDVVVTTGTFAVKAELQKAAMPKMEM